MKTRIGIVAAVLGMAVLGGAGCNQAPDNPPTVVQTPGTTNNYHSTKVIEKDTTPAPASSSTTTTVAPGASTTTNPDGSSTTTTPGASSTTTTVH